MITKAIAVGGALLEHLGQRMTAAAKASHAGDFDVFLKPEYLAINKARLDHLATLNLPLNNRAVVEVGAGIGLMSGFFEERGCKVLCTDGRVDNVEEARRRYPAREAKVWDLNGGTDAALPGMFDLVFCYGTLYHLSNPERALNSLAKVSSDLILLETCVTPGVHTDIHLVRESESFDQAIDLVGSRPTRPWIMSMLKKAWGYAYTTVTQPNHPQFETNWRIPLKHGNHRAVFVGSRHPLSLPALTESLPERQIRIGGGGGR